MTKRLRSALVLLCPALALVAITLVTPASGSARDDSAPDGLFPVELEYVTVVPETITQDSPQVVRRFLFRAASWSEWTNEQVEGPDALCHILRPSDGLSTYDGSCATGALLAGPTAFDGLPPAANPWLTPNGGLMARAAAEDEQPDAEAGEAKESALERSAQVLGVDDETLLAGGEVTTEPCASLGYLVCADPSTVGQLRRTRVVDVEHELLVREEERFGDVNLSLFEVQRVTPLDSYQAGRPERP